MIRFESISYRNILSVGQAPLTLDLHQYRLTALHGPSGSGKSLFLDAISFALFGRAFRDINKTDLINTINGKGLLVELDLSVGKDKYKITRGLKPNVFTISKNGDMLNQDSHAKDQQKFLEDQILKMNWKMFTHVVMLGAANYTPFMRLKPNERKKMVESILGIDVFSTMNALIKTKISDETLRYKSAVERKDALTRQLQYLEAQQKSYEEKKNQEIRDLTEKMLGLRDEKKRVDAQVSELEVEIDEQVKSFDPQVEIPLFDETFEETFAEEFSEVFDEEFVEVDQSEFDVTDLVNERAVCKSRIVSCEEKINAISKDILFYQEHETCPTCSQGISHDFREDAVAKLQEQERCHHEAIKKASEALEAIKVKAEAVQARKKEYALALEQYKVRKRQHEAKRTAFEDRRRGYEARLRAYEGRRRDYEASLKKVQLLVEQKRVEFEKLIDAKRKVLVERRERSSAIVAEAKFLKQAIEDKKSESTLDNREEIGRLSSELKSCDETIDWTAKRVRLFRDSQAVIKDDGVKAEILKRYVPTLNKHINQYLIKMGMFLSFELDQEFNDMIRSRHRDVLSYANYSEGERQRLDLAVLLAWRHLAQAQSAVNTNLLVLDEVLDSYLDQATTEMILNLLRGDEFQSFNIVIISHKEGLSENFDRTFQFQKKNNFTSLAC